MIPTQSLTPRDRQYNFDNQALYEGWETAPNGFANTWGRACFPLLPPMRRTFLSR